MATKLQPPVSHLGSLPAYLDYWLDAGSTGPLPSCLHVLCHTRLSVSMPVPTSWYVAKLLWM